MTSMASLITFDEWVLYRPGQPHPSAGTLVEICLSHPGLTLEGKAEDFNWKVLEEDDIGARIIGYRVVS